MRSWVKSDYLKLVPILVLAFYMAFIPHQGYDYAVHLDEWLHWSYADELVSNGGTEDLTSPFSGRRPEWNQSVELGFHMFWGIFQQITGLSWLVISKYFPAIIFMLAVLAVFVLARRLGFGWESALLTCLVPTTVGILGPGFLVPVALGILIVPLSLFVAFNLRGWWSYLLLFLFNCFLVVSHGATAVSLVIILIPYILLNLRQELKHVILLAMALAIPFLGPFPWMLRVVLNKMEIIFLTQTLPQYVGLPRSFAIYGYLPCILYAIGTFCLLWKGGPKRYGLVFGAVALMAMVITFVELHYGLALVFLRGFVHLQLMMGIVGGAGLWWLRTAELPSKLASRLKSAFISRNFGNMVCLIIIILTLALTIPDRYDTSYYHMIDKRDYAAFVWISENVDERYDKAILDPWKGTAFTAITGRKVYTRISKAPQQSDRQAYKFLRERCTDTTFLKKRDISIVYTRGGCNNPDLVKVRENVYLIKIPTTR